MKVKCLDCGHEDLRKNQKDHDCGGYNTISKFYPKVEEEEKKVIEKDNDTVYDIKCRVSQGIQGTVYCFETTKRRIYINETTGNKMEQKLKMLRPLVKPPTNNRFMNKSTVQNKQTPASKFAFYKKHRNMTIDLEDLD